MNLFKNIIFYLTKIKKFFFPFYNKKELREVFDILEKDEEKEVAMYVGGCVRKFLKNEEIDDIDIATILTPEKVIEKFKISKHQIIETGLDHGTITVIINHTKVEITTLRKDILTDGRRAKVEFTSNWIEDSNRRDFTINSIYLTKKGKIFDPQSGVKDLRNNFVQFIGEPDKRIKEDYLRILRFLRFNITYSGYVKKSDYNFVLLNLNGVKSLSKERILDELFKILDNSNFLIVNQNENLKDLFLLIFPEFKNLNRLKNVEHINNIIKIDRNFLLKILLIDDSDNFEYFCHKYPVSKNIKNELIKLSKIYKQQKENKFFFKKDLKKNTYLFSKFDMQTMNIISYLENSKNKLQEFKDINNEIVKMKIPKFKFDGKYLLDKGFSEGKKIGALLKQIEEKWVSDNFTITDKTVDEILNNNRR